MLEASRLVYRLNLGSGRGDVARQKESTGTFLGMREGALAETHRHSARGLAFSCLQTLGRPGFLDIW